MKRATTGSISRKVAFWLNVLIVSAYVAIVVLTPTPWKMFAGFLLLAVMIRCATLYWMGPLLQAEAEVSWLFLLWNLIIGLLFSAVLLVGLWWFGRFWLAGTKVIVPCIAVYVAYQSTFPMLSPSHRTSSDNRESPNKPME